MYPEDKIDFIEETTSTAMKLYEVLRKNPDRQTEKQYEELSVLHKAIVAAIEEHYMFLQKENIPQSESYLTAWLYDKYNMTDVLDEIEVCVEKWERSKIPQESSSPQ
jgi:hypothetical protein